MNKSQEEKKVTRFTQYPELTLMTLKPFQNPTVRSPFDHFLDPQSMPRLFKTRGPEGPEALT